MMPFRLHEIRFLLTLEKSVKYETTIGSEVKSEPNKNAGLMWRDGG